MYVAVKQFNKPLAIFRTRSRKALSDRDVARAQALTETIEMETGYYDIVLTLRPDDSRYDVDSAIEIK